LTISGFLFQICETELKFNMKEVALIIGASRGLGKSLAYVLAENGINMLLASRNLRELEVLADELSGRFKIITKPMQLDVGKTGKTESLKFIEDCFSHFPEINQIYITAAIVDDADVGPAGASVLKEMIDVNFTGIACLVAAFSERLSGKNVNVTVMSSIAAIRPRGRNIAYSSSKIALEYFVKGLQHFYQNSLFRLQLYRLGYMDTAMTAGKDLLLPVVASRKTASYIFNNRNGKFHLKYYPRFWALAAVVIKSLPWILYRKVNQ
jgi:decaprenylphospho-beta-D-erythro-pentofuranosid-2-ulose 2-reductase